MKRLTFLILALLLVLPLSAWYAPSFTVGCGVNTLVLDKKAYQSVKTGLELGLVGIKIKSFTLSVPLTIAHVTKSMENKGLLSPSFFKASIGIEGLLEGLVEGERIGASAALYYGYEDYTDEKAVMLYLEGRVAAHYRISKYFSLMVPVSYTYTPEGNEVSVSLAVRIGGDLL